MPIDPTKLAALQTLSLIGKPAVAEYLMVEWLDGDSGQTKYYATSDYDQMPPFQGIGVAIDARIMGDPFRSFELNPDLRTETITVKFDDIDKVITGRFQTYGSGVRCELFYYYPSQMYQGTFYDLDLTVSVWFGQLTAPKIYGWKTVECIATNGFRSREQTIPRRPKPKECTSNFGGLMPDAEAIRTNLCPYDRGIGGTEGLLNGAVPFADCPKLSTADCDTRFGHHRYYGGFVTTAAAVVSDGNTGYVAVSKGNASALKEPIRVIAGTKHVRACQMLLWRREVNNSTPDHGWVRGVWEVGEGPVQRITNVQVKEKIIEASQQVIRLGTRGQSSTGYSTDVSNFSGTALFLAAYGWVNAAEIEAKDLSAECDVIGYSDVAVYNNTAAGNGLAGVYYSGSTFTTVLGRRIDYYLNFDTTYTPPFSEVPATDWCARWTGTIKPRYTEAYTFYGSHDDNMKLIVNGVTIFDVTGPSTTSSGVTAVLTADTEYTIQVDFVQGNSPGLHPWRCILSWESASQALEVVPNSRLFHTGSTGYIRQWTDDRVWWLLELYSNRRWGMGYPLARFTTADFYTASVWGRSTVDFVVDYPDGETETFSHRRSSFNAILEGRAVAEQVEDICRAGGLSIPFQHEGAFTVSPFRVATAGELSAARVFTDEGEDRNIVWENGEPAIKLEQIPNDKVVNEVELTFEEAINKDAERPITVNDPNQKLLAGRELGDNNLKTVPKKFSAFGVRALAEAIKVAYRLLRFGEFDEGGTQNNLKATITVPFEQALGLKRYDIIKITSDLLSGFVIGLDDGVNDWTETPQYFRVLKMNKRANGTCEIVAQAYNHTAYTAFETVTDANPNPNPTPPIIVYLPPACTLTFGAVTYDPTTENMVIPINPC